MMARVDILVFVCHHGLMVEAVGKGESAVTPKVFRSYWLGSIFVEAILQWHAFGPNSSS